MVQMSVAEGLAHAVSQTARMAWFTGHYLATRRLDVLSGAGLSRLSPEARRRTRKTRLALASGAIDLVRRDAVDITAGVYRAPRDMVPNPLEAIRDLLRYYRDLPRARARRVAGIATQARELVGEAEFPDYFTQNFHFQTDGYLSRRSAELYDFQVEVLFTGTADAMRRRALPPIAECIADRGDSRSISLVDIACGTGGFLAELRHNWPELNLAGLDISPPYLERARRRGSAVDAIEFIQGNAEKIPLPDGSRDIVTCVYLFHELPRMVRETVLREMVRVLRPGGRLILLDSLQLGDTPALDPALTGFPETFHEPYYLDYLEHDLVALLAATGLRVVTSEPAYLSKLFVAEKPV
jgi:ubiquinone/menaquinone biosynthesis C-methylase UbiE